MYHRNLLWLCRSAAAGSVGQSGRTSSNSISDSSSPTPGPSPPSQQQQQQQQHITVRSIHKHDYSFTLPWPLGPLPSPSSSSSPSSQYSAQDGGDGTSSEYVTTPRSPFAVMRGRRTRVGRCASGVLPDRWVGRPFISPTFAATASASSSAPPQPQCCQGQAPWCCCAALLYRTNTNGSSGASHSSGGGGGSPGPQPSADTEDSYQRDAFALALKLSNSEAALRATVGAEAYEGLLGSALAGGGEGGESHAVALCADPTKLLQTPFTTSGSGGARGWTARTLLSADEENRLKWLWEVGDLGACYARAPTLRALFVMWNIAKAAASPAGAGVGIGDGSGGDGEVPPRSSGDTPSPPSSPLLLPTAADIEHVYHRTREQETEVTLCDIGALAAFAAAADQSSRDAILRLVMDLIKPEVVARLVVDATEDDDGSASPPPPSLHAALELVLVLTALCQHASGLRAAHRQRRQRGEGERGSAPHTTTDAELSQADEHRLVTVVRIAAKMKVVRDEVTAAAVAAAAAAKGRTKSSSASSSGSGSSSSSATTAIAVSALVAAFMRDAREVAAGCLVASSSPILAEVTVWLLRELPRSPACYRHFRLVVDHGPAEALAALDRSGLLTKRHVDLSTVNGVILPLLEHCGNEDLFTLVMRDVIGLLEDRLRRDPHSFTQDDMRLIAELGTRLFAVSAAGPGGGRGSLSGNGISSSHGGAYTTTSGSGGGFDGAAREQMEQLHVMDGSPWALCVSSYRSLKEIVQNLVKDQRKLKRQVQEQMRSIGLAAAAGVSGAVSGGGGGGGGSGWSEPTAATAAATAATAATDGADGTSDGTPSATAAAAAVDENGDTEEDKEAAAARMIASPMVRQRFLVFVEDLVKELVDDHSAHSERPIVVSTELFAFVNRHVPVPNIQDEYRRKIFLLVNVAEDPHTLRQRRRERRRQLRREAEARRRAAADRRRPGGAGHRSRFFGTGATEAADITSDTTIPATPTVVVDDVDLDKGLDEDDELASELDAGVEEIPAELRFLVSSLPLTLSPWASVMILREVLAESAGRNPRYTYVLNAAIDLQLPISTTRSRIATTLNMWRFLNSQSHKLSLKESVVVKQRCFFNLPMSYILSSYWSLLTSLVVTFIIMLNVVGLDFESQLVANSLFQKFTPWEEVVDVGLEPWNTEAAADLASGYFDQDEISQRHRQRESRRSTDVILSSASYLFLGYDDQRRPMTIIPISSEPRLSEGERTVEEFAGAAAVLRELSLHAPFPFYMDLERPMSVKYVEARVAERIRRVSFNNTWFVPRMIIRTFPLGRQYTERMLVTHTCAQANLTRRRITFLFYIEDGVPVTQQFLRGLQESFLSRSANLVLVVHERSLDKGGVTPRGIEILSAAAAAKADGGGEAVAAAAATPTTPDTDGSSNISNNGSDSPLRVLPYCRQLHDIPEGFFAATTTTQVGGPVSGSSNSSNTVAAAQVLLKSFSPFARHFGLGLSLGSDDQRKRRWVEEKPEERGALAAVVGDSVDVLLGATAATVHLAVMPVRFALRATNTLFSSRDHTNDGGGGSAGTGGGPGAEGEQAGPVVVVGRDEEEEDGGLHPRKVISVPFSMVKEAMEKAAATGQSAMQWLGDTDAGGGEAESGDKTGVNTATHQSERGVRPVGAVWSEGGLGEGAWGSARQWWHNHRHWQQQQQQQRVQQPDPLRWPPMAVTGSSGSNLIPSSSPPLSPDVQPAVAAAPEATAAAAAAASTSAPPSSPSSPPPPSSPSSRSAQMRSAMDRPPLRPVPPPPGYRWHSAPWERDLWDTAAAAASSSDLAVSVVSSWMSARTGRPDDDVVNPGCPISSSRRQSAMDH